MYVCISVKARNSCAQAKGRSYERVVAPFSTVMASESKHPLHGPKMSRTCVNPIFNDEIVDLDYYNKIETIKIY